MTQNGAGIPNRAAPRLCDIPSPNPYAFTPNEFRKNAQNTVTAIDRTNPRVSRYRVSYSRSNSPFRGYSALINRYPGRKNKSTSAPMTRAVATIAPRTSSGNARPSGRSLFEDCADDLLRRKRLRRVGAYVRVRRISHGPESPQDVRARLR